MASQVDLLSTLVAPLFLVVLLSSLLIIVFLFEGVIMNREYIDIAAVYPSYAPWGETHFFTYSTADSSMGSVDSYGEDGWFLNPTKNDTYITVVATHKPTGREFFFSVTCGQLIPDGIYSISNRHSKKFVTVGEFSQIQQASLEDSSKWRFSYRENGYYEISSVLETNPGYLSLASDGSVVLQSSTAPDVLWRVAVTPSGNYRFIPNTDIDGAMTLSSASLMNEVGIKKTSYVMM